LQTQKSALHFACGGHGQLIDEFNVFRVLIGRQATSDMALQIRNQLAIEDFYLI
jgi:hypothetical protein